MAKLIRQKRENKVSPIGVVKMTGLRQMGQAMGQVGQFADEVRVEATKALEQVKLNEANDRLDYLQSLPSQELDRVMAEQQAAEKEGRGELVYQENSLGRPQPLVQGQIPTKDVGPWSPTWMRQWNRRANEWNALKAGNQISNFIFKEKQRQIESGEFNPDAFEKSVATYTDAVVKNTDMRAAGAVRMAVDADIHKGYQELYKLRHDKDTELYNAEHAVVDRKFKGLIHNAIVDGGVNDKGLPLLIKGAWQHKLRKLEKDGAGEGEIAIEFEKFARDFHTSGITHQINHELKSVKTLGELGEFTEETLTKITNVALGRKTIPSLQIDAATGDISLTEVNFADVYPTFAEQETVAKGWRDLVKTKFQLAQEVQKMRVESLQYQFNEMMFRKRQAVNSGDANLIAATDKEMLDFINQERNSDFAEFQDKALKNWVASRTFAETEGNRQFAMETADGAEGSLEELEGMMPEAMRKQYEALYQLDSEDLKRLGDGMSPSKLAQAYQARIGWIQSQLTSKPSTSSVELAQAMDTGGRLKHTKKLGTEAQKMVNAFAAANNIPLRNGIYRPFEYNQETNEAEFQHAIRFTRMFARTGVMPSQIIGRVRDIAMNTGTGVSNAEKESVVRWYRAVRNSRMFTKDELKGILGERTNNALDYAYNSIQDAGMPSASDAVIGNMTRIASGEIQLDQISPSGKIPQDLQTIITEQSDRWFGDVGNVPDQMRTDVGKLANIIRNSAEGQTLDNEEIVEKAVEQAKKKWAVSNWGIKGKDTWSKEPIDQYYKNLPDDGSPTSPLNQIIRRQLGDGKYTIGFDTPISMSDVSLPNEIDKESQMFFVSDYSVDGKRIYTPYIRVQMGNQVVPYALLKDGYPVMLDLSAEDAFEGRRKAARQTILDVIETRKDMREIAMNKFAVSGFMGSERGFVESGITNEKVMAMRDIVEMSDDIRLLESELKDLETRAVLNFDQKIFDMYRENTLSTRLSDVIKLQTAMNHYEFDNWLEIPNERKVEIIKKYNLSDLKAPIKKYFGIDIDQLETDKPEPLPQQGTSDGA